MKTKNKGRMLGAQVPGASLFGEQNCNNAPNANCLGRRLVTSNEGEVAVGQFNKSTKKATNVSGTLFSVGNGTANIRKNAFEVKDNGAAYCGNGHKLVEDIWEEVKAEYGDKIMLGGGDDWDDEHLITDEDIYSLLVGGYGALILDSHFPTTEYNNAVRSVILEVYQDAGITSSDFTIECVWWQWIGYNSYYVLVTDEQATSQDAYRLIQIYAA